MITPLSFNMNKIDTEYQALSDIDPEIVRFYSEDIRTRVVGYTEGEMPEPITEEYTVIVLNQPDEVTYEYVQSRRDRRFSEEVVKSYIPSAILREDFKVNHIDYLAWLEELAIWQTEQPMTQEGVTEEGEPNRVLTPEPVRPVIDMAIRRSVYELVEDVSSNVEYTVLTDRYTEVTDDVLFTVTRVFISEPFTDAQVVEVEQENARDYLFKTDWMAARKLETGIDIPDEISVKRNEARVILNNTFIEPNADFQA